MASHALVPVFVRREASIMRSACLAAGVLLLTACAGQPTETHRLHHEAPHRGTAIAPGDEWAPLGATGDALVAPGPFEGSSADGAGAPSPERMGALESAETDADGGARRSYVVPAFEILGFQILLNQFDRRFVDHDVYATDASSIRRNLRRGWIIDEDPFSTNQFGHPYSGSIYHGFARSAGLGYWESLGYDFAASAVWEVAGETGAPSLNDQITTTFAGSFLGEALFRTADLVLRSGDGKPGPIRSGIAALIAPSAGINRLAFGDRFCVFESKEPAVFYWIGVGARRNTTLADTGILTDVKRDHLVAAFALDYGLPGKPGSTYTRPFDYYHFEASATTSRSAIPENIMVRGLLYGTDYASGPDYRGIWGLYGSYDYFSPEIFKVSSTALSLGTTGQCLMSEKFALQGSGMGGVGYTAAGTNTGDRSDREYRYGAGPQALLALRLVYGDVAMLSLTANDYLISGGASSADPSGSENVLRAQVSLTVRVSGPHAIGVQYVESRRNPRLSGVSTARQSVGALSLFYEFLSDEKFGVVR